MIDEHNAKIPPRKRDKESLPEISSINVNGKYRIHRDPKKPGPGEYIRKYHNVGFVDAASSKLLNNPAGGVSAFSVAS
jgi:hypothetical protein